MDVLLEIFSFSGRANRARFLWHILLDDLVIASMAILLIVLTLATPLAIVPLAGVAFAGTWAALAVTVKRFHDLDQSGWRVLLMAVPIVNIFVGLVLLFKAGTDGPNRFGLDPLADLKADRGYLTE